MRYQDSGSRDPKHALGFWLSEVLSQDSHLAEMRIQTGFFSSDALGYFEDALKTLSQANGHTRIIIGSNEGMTPRAAVSSLIEMAGEPRTGLRIGIASFGAGYFHPKVFHFMRADGSSASYVGSANLTRSGTTSLNIESGILLDTKEGDLASVLTSVATAIDAWFEESRPGLYEVRTEDDLNPLVQAGMLDVPAPPRPPRNPQPLENAVQEEQQIPSLRPLVSMPAIKATSMPTPQAAQASAFIAQSSPITAPRTPLPTVAPSPPQPNSSRVAKVWGKTLSPSDAQRKPTGNQRGAITLTQGDYRGKIDQKTYFRNDLFDQEKWVRSRTTTGQEIETTNVTMHVTIDDAYHGALNFRVTNGANRESLQDNYTAELHLGRIRTIFRETDMGGKHLTITLDSGGEYWLTIS